MEALTMEENNIFAIRLKEARIKKNISQAELSRLTGIAPATLSSYEKGKSPTIDKAIKIANVLDVSLDWLSGKKTESFLETRESTFRFVLKAIALIISEGFASIPVKDSEDEPSELIFDELGSNYFSDFIGDFLGISTAKKFLPPEMAQTLDDTLIEKYVNKLMSCPPF